MAVSAATATAAAAATPLPWPADVAARHAASSPARAGRRRRLPVVRCQSSSVDDKPKSKRSLLDNASNLLTNLLSGGSLGAMPVAEGAVTDLFGRPLFFSLYDWFLEHGSVYKLAFGPKSFVVVSDPIVARHILRENAFCYDELKSKIASANQR